MACNWPEGACACYLKKQEEQETGDIFGKVWYHCEKGITLTKSSLGRFFYYCGKNQIDIGDVWFCSPKYDRSQVCVSIKMKPEQKEPMETELKIKLHDPPVLSLN